MKMKDLHEKNILMTPKSLLVKLFGGHNYIMFKVGDIINEKYFPDRIGVVIEVSRSSVVVRWHKPNPNNRLRTTLERLDRQFIELAIGEEILLD